MARGVAPPCAIRLSEESQALPAALSYEPALSLPGFNLEWLNVHACPGMTRAPLLSTRTFPRARALRA
eukprot:12229162-Alexandrium_andersonii.AAC.1